MDEDVTVEYGADLHTIDHGSGFPNKKTKNLLPGDEVCVNSYLNRFQEYLLDYSFYFNTLCCIDFSL